MRRVLRIAVGVFAALGAAYAAFAVYALFFLPVCKYVIGPQAQSPDQRYSATFSQTVCADASKSHSRVEMHATGKDQRVVILDIQGTPDVDLTWNGDAELQVLLPVSAIATRYTAYNGWPRVVEKRTSQP